MPEYSDPTATLRLLDALETSGFDDSAFAVVHHHQPPQTISEHRNYCNMLADGEDCFQTANNQLIQKRLEMILTMYRSGGFSKIKNPVFKLLAAAAILELPHDRRTLAEQYKGPDV